jgi:hypothetical protein
MKKEFEDYLWERIPMPGSNATTNVRLVIKEMIQKQMIQSYKQALCTLEKWSRKGLYDYGVCLDLGWKTIK